MCKAFAAYARGSRVLDLCCSYGLLGARLKAEGWVDLVLGVDGDEDVVASARLAGVPIVLEHLVVSKDTMPALMATIKSQQVNVVVARRALPELFGDDLTWGKQFALELILAGVNEVFLEGRVDSERSINPLRNVDCEANLFSACFAEDRRVGAVAYLRRRQ